MENVVIGIDIGGTNTVFGVVDARGNMLARSYPLEGEDKSLFEEYKIKTQKHVTFDAFVDALITKLLLFLSDRNITGKIKGIGIGAPNANHKTGEIVNPPNLIWDKGKSAEERVFNICEILNEKLSKKLGYDVTVALDNDVNAAALGEYFYGEARGMKDFIVIALGTGVGSGIYSNGSLVRGHNGFAGELGHTVSVRHNGRKCGCGGTGHLEIYTSATGVAITAREFLDARPNEKSLLRNVDPITSLDVAEKADLGDQLAKDVFEFTGRILGEAFANFVEFSDPEAIIMFGGLTKSWDKYLEDPTRKAMEKNLMEVFRGKVKLILSGLPEADAAVLGASALGWEK